jgi:endonuclease/exonuclease/phosphatase family metal-dependent hydrolase
MPKLFSLASWNVEHFKGAQTRVRRVVETLKDIDPDVFALLEVEGKEVFEEIVSEMDGYSFHITEGVQTQEILIGVRGGLTAFFTQKTEYQEGNTYLRPGALLTLTIGGEQYPILFLHTKALSEPIGLGIRDEQFQRAFNFKRFLDEKAGGDGKANFLFLGDLNTAGLEYPYGDNIDASREIRRLKGRAGSAKMKVLKKDTPATWWNGPGSSYPPADFDHVIASKQLKFKKFGSADVTVLGWPKKATDDEKKDWIGRYSDHGVLYLEVHS